MSSLFGVELPTSVNFIIAFVFVLLLIGAAAWLVRRFGAAQIEAAARGRQPRLAVVDSAAVDGRRKLVIIRRDNVEHLLMIGGPSDVVVETNIVRGTAAATRDAPRCAQRRSRDPAACHAAGRSDAVAVAAGAGAGAGPAAGPQCPRRGGRNLGHARGVRRPPPAPPVPDVRPVRPADTLAGLADESPAAGPCRGGARASRPRRPGPAVAPRADTARRSHVAPPNPAADQSLAEMAQRLEAALRRPMAQKVVAETQRVTATVDVKAVDAERPRPSQDRNRAISSKKWRAF